MELRRVDNGGFVASAATAHTSTSPPVSEQDPEEWWQALRSSLEQVDRGLLEEVKAVSVAAQQHGLVVLDSENRPLRSAMLWNDTRSAPQASRLIEERGAEWWAKAVGSVPVPSFTITKLAWMADHEPDLLKQAVRVMLPHDYLTWRLTGQHVTDRGDASGTGWFDPSLGSYLNELIGDVAGTDVELQVPKVLAFDEAAGEVRADVARDLGLVAGVLVAPGTGDNMSAALALGLQAGDVAVSLGTSGVLSTVTDRPLADVSGQIASFADATGKYLPLVCVLNATKVTDTVRSWLGVDQDTFADMALNADAGGPPYMLPYFDGERTPNLPNATGQIVGLRSSTTREELTRMAHLGVVAALWRGRLALAEFGVAGDGRVLLIGGGARSPAYRQLLADVWQAEVAVPEIGEVVARGAAVQAASILTGSHPDDVVARWDKEEPSLVSPRPQSLEQDLWARWEAAFEGSE